MSSRLIKSIVHKFYSIFKACREYRPTFIAVAVTFIAIIGAFAATLHAGFNVNAFAAPIPQNLRVITSTGTTNSLPVSWNQPSGPVTGYWLSRSGQVIKINTTSLNVNYVDTSLIPGMNYVYKVASSDSAGVSPWSLKASGITRSSTGAFVKPHAPFTDNSNMCQACHSIHMAPTKYKMLYKRYSNSPDDYSTELSQSGQSLPGADLCFNCHDGTGADYNVKQYYDQPTSELVAFPGHMTRRDSTTESEESFGGWRPIQGLPKGSKLPCMVCHDSHVSHAEGKTQAVTGTPGNWKMLADGLLKYAKSPSGAWTSSTTAMAVLRDVTNANIIDTANNKWEKCTVCHHDESRTNGIMRVAGLDLYWPSEFNDTPEDELDERDHGTVRNCACHAGNAGSRDVINVHALGKGGRPEPSNPQDDCSQCHPDVVERVMDPDIVSRHYVAAPTGNLSPSTNPDRCTSKCHNNHGPEREAKKDPNSLHTGSFNLYVDAPNLSGAANYDYTKSVSQPGLCLSCHRTPQTSNRPGGTSNGTPVISAIDPAMFQDTAHSYASESYKTRDGKRSYVMTCLKCHRDNDTDTDFAKWGPHASANRSLLRLPAAGIPGSEEEVCFSCHKVTTKPVYETSTQPSGIGNYDQWTFTGAASKVAAVTDNDDNSYIRTTGDGNRQLFTLAPVSLPAGMIIDRVVVKVRFYVNGSNSQRFNIYVRSGSTNNSGTSINSTQTVAEYSRVLTRNPAGNIPWTEAAVNALQVGVRKPTNSNNNEYRATKITVDIYRQERDEGMDTYAGRFMPTNAWRLSQAWNTSRNAGHGRFLLSQGIDRHRASEGYTASWQTGWMPSSSRHVECYDCHNPHYVSRAYDYTAPAPYTGSINELETPIKGFRSNVLRGVWGVYPTTNWNAIPTAANYFAQTWNSPNPNGILFYTSAASKQAYICLKCHSAYAYGTRANDRPLIPSGMPAGAGSTPARQSDILADFNPNNIGYHPVFSVGLNQPTMGQNPNWRGNNGRLSTAYDPSTVGTAGPGLTTAFVPPWGASSLVTCSDCHSHQSASYSRGYYTSAPAMIESMDFPRGPHGSSNVYLLRSLDRTIRYQRNNQSWFTYQTASLPSARHFCLNCHRGDVYWGGIGSPNAPGISRVNHIPGESGQSHQTQPSANRWQIVCMTCHGGETMGTMHGTGGAAPAGGGNRLGKRLIYGATWRGWSVSTTQNIRCWTKSSTADGINNCSEGHSGDSGSQQANYNY